MRSIGVFVYGALAACVAFLSAPGAGVAADTAARPAAISGARHKVIFQVSDNDPRKWNLALNNVKNVQEDLGKSNVEIELVAYGPGLPMLKLDSEVASRVSDALAQGVKILACENTMTNTKTTRADMLPNIGYVKAGVVELMEKQQQGWAYIRP
jgi:intracellular sulfur oxidation DsrE/DsrF family protein